MLTANTPRVNSGILIRFQVLSFVARNLDAIFDLHLAAIKKPHHR